MFFDCKVGEWIIINIVYEEWEIISSQKIKNKRIRNY